MKSLVTIIMIVGCVFILSAQENVNQDQPQLSSQKEIYEYYLDDYRDATINVRVGGALFTAGVVGLGIAAMIAKNSNDLDDGAGAFILIVLSAPPILIGIPMMINGGIRRNKARKVINEYENKVDFSIGINRNGVGLVIRF